MRSKSPRPPLWGIVLAIPILVIAACSSGTTTTTATGSKPYAGTSLTMWEFEIPGVSDAHKEDLPLFEAATGIKVTQTTLTETSYTTKLQLAQVAKSSAPDVFYTDFAFKGQVVSRGAGEYLDSYIKDPSKTPASYNAADLQLTNLCQIDGKLICIPFFSNGTFYYYNKKIFADAGISGPPQTIQDVLTDAKKTNNPSKGTYGICMRGAAESANQYAAFLMGQYFLPYDDNKAVILDKNYRPLLDTPQATAWMTEYADLMQHYAPPGIQNMGYLDCNREFEQGRVAQYFEADPWVGEFLDPTKSKIVSDVGFSVIPCPPSNPNNCVANAGGGWFINGFSKNKGAAWELMKWLTSEDNVVRWGVKGKSLFQVLRKSAGQKVAQQAGFPQEVVNSEAYAKSHSQPSPFPPISNIADMVQTVSVMCTRIVAGQVTIGQGLTQAQAQITASMKKAGYYTGT